MKHKVEPIAYRLTQEAADAIYRFATAISDPLVHYSPDKVTMLEEFVDNAKKSAVNITYHLHQIDKTRYEWTDKAKEPTP